MNITILHSEQVEDSRALMQELGIHSANVDVVESVYQGNALKVIAKHAKCVEYMPNFSAYPSVVLEIDGVKRCKSSIKNYDDILSFQNELNQPAIAPKTTQYSRLDFMFLFSAEWNSIKQAALTDSQVSLIYDSFILADYISVSDTRTVSALNYLVSVGLVSQEKLESVLS